MYLKNSLFKFNFLKLHKHAEQNMSIQLFYKKYLNPDSARVTLLVIIIFDFQFYMSGNILLRKMHNNSWKRSISLLTRTISLCKSKESYIRWVLLYVEYTLYFPSVGNKLGYIFCQCTLSIVAAHYHLCFEHVFKNLFQKKKKFWKPLLLSHISMYSSCQGEVHRACTLGLTWEEKII